MTSHPLQNRVRPDGVIEAEAARGMFLGNRGGKIHDPASRTLHASKRWASRQWICCVLDFKQRKRQVMGQGYTELFFLDEVTAFAAGHRPCFECRRSDALEFAERWPRRPGSERPLAPHMDKVLHGERLDGRCKRMWRQKWGDLPVGSMICSDGRMIAKSAFGPLTWCSAGYSSSDPIIGDKWVECLTPPTMVHIIASGYQPRWHPSAATCR